MRFDVDAKSFAQAVKVVSHATTTSAATPILENTLLTAQDGKLILTGNNLEMAIEIEVENVVIHEEGRITLSHRFLASYASLVHEETIQVTKETGNSIVLSTQKNTTKIKGVSANEFPVIPAVRKDRQFRIDSESLRKACTSTLFSAASGNIRPTLAGVHMSISSESVVFASTDSFRLSEYRVQQEVNIDQDMSFIIPARTANELLKLLQEPTMIDMYVAENQLLIFFDNVKIFSRLLNGHFPEYGNFFPKTYATRAVCRRDELIQSLKQVSLISRENNYNTKVTFVPQEGLSLDTGDTEVGAGKVQVGSEIEGKEDSI